jgi:hypothetical protein
VDNVLEKFGMIPDLTKSFSISFIDDFADCSYRSFLSKMVGVPQRPNANKIYGSACHAGLQTINNCGITNNYPCTTCIHDCKMGTPEKKLAVTKTVEQCGVQQLMMESFGKLFNTAAEEGVKKVFTDKGKADEGADLVAKLKRIGPNAMKEAIFLKQPAGQVVMAESRLRGQIADIPFSGVLDLYMMCGDKGLVFDYKTRADDPTTAAFPLRQFTTYAKLLRDEGSKVDGFGTIFLLKKEPPKKKTKKSKEVHEYAVAQYFKLEGNEELYEHTLRMLVQDMLGIRRCIENGIMLRNRNSMYCSTCDVKFYCENDPAIEKFLSNRIKKEIPNDRKEPQGLTQGPQGTDDQANGGHGKPA